MTIKGEGMMISRASIISKTEAVSEAQTWIPFGGRAGMNRLFSLLTLPGTACSDAFPKIDRNYLFDA